MLSTSPSSALITCNPPSERITKPSNFSKSASRSSSKLRSQSLLSFHTQYVKFEMSPRRSIIAASSATVGSTDYVEEPATNVKFRAQVSPPGCSSPLSLIGTGFREKVFAIIGVKVYAAGFYLNSSITSSMKEWKGQSAEELAKNKSLFSSIFDAPIEKLVQIVFVRAVDGKTFWDALDEAITPRVKNPNSGDESAIATFKSIFYEKEFKKGSSVYLTWIGSSKMNVSVAVNELPQAVDGSIDSVKVSSALFDVYFGDATVSPSLKNAVTNGFASLLV